MEIELILALLMFATAIGALLAGYSVALTLGGVALLFALIGIALGAFPEPLLRTLPSRIQGNSIMQNQVLVAVPLFVLMGVILERSRVAEDLLNISGRLLGKFRGGLGYAVVLVGALLAASTGIVGATVITMTLIALPTMLRQNYDPKLASGTIAASGTLGQIIPPSIVLILLADALSTAASNASQSLGAKSTVVSVGDLFAGALIPGLLLVGFYMMWIAFTAFMRPSACPPLDTTDTEPITTRDVVFSLGAPLALIFTVLGAILGGVAPPTEAAALGAAGAILLAGIRLSSNMPSRLNWTLLGAIAVVPALVLLRSFFDLRAGVEHVTVWNGFGMTAAALASLLLLFGVTHGLRVLRHANELRPALGNAVQITSMVFLILIGASLFSLVFRGFGGDEYVAELLGAIPGGRWGALVAAMLVMFFLGFFLDFIEIVFVVVPLVAPVLIAAGFDPVWLGVLMALNLQTSFLTPPFGFALFYLRGAAPDEVQTIDIWRGAIPFIGLQITMLLIVAFYQPLATGLPEWLNSDPIQAR